MFLTVAAYVLMALFTFNFLVTVARIADEWPKGRHPEDELLRTALTATLTFSFAIEAAALTAAAAALTFVYIARCVHDMCYRR